jgi:hypothetical protein
VSTRTDMPFHDFHRQFAQGDQRPASPQGLSGNPVAMPRASHNPAGTGDARGPQPPRDARTLRSENPLFEALRDGEPPIPLTTGQGNMHAMKLHSEGYSFAVIGRVMGTYHGIYLGERAWRHRLRKLGAPPRLYHGRVPPPNRTGAGKRQREMAAA